MLKIFQSLKVNHDLIYKGLSVFSILILITSITYSAYKIYQQQQLNTQTQKLLTQPHTINTNFSNYSSSAGLLFSQPVQASTQTIQLLGIIYSSSINNSQAILQANGLPAQVLGIGANIAGYTLSIINQLTVVLIQQNNSSNQLTLQLPKKATNIGNTNPAMNAPMRTVEASQMLPPAVVNAADLQNMNVQQTAQMLETMSQKPNLSPDLNAIPTQNNDELQKKLQSINPKSNNFSDISGVDASMLQIPQQELTDKPKP